MSSRCPRSSPRRDKSILRKIAPGLLYLENKYVVPGGRFNEMYGWDSYFIILGLLRAGRIDLARGMVENFFFEIEHYGTILNANRAYYLTRSQPPFLTSMIMAVYEADKAAGHENRAWLEKAYGYASKDYETWNREPHIAGSTGLARYYDFGNGPAPESLKDEAGIHRKVASYFLLHPAGRPRLSGRRTGEAQIPPWDFNFPCNFAMRPTTMAKAGVREGQRRFRSVPTTTKATGPCANPASIFPFALDPTAPRPITTPRFA